MSRTMKPFINSLLAIWFGLVLFLAAKGAFVQPPETPPLPILLGWGVLYCFSRPGTGS